MNEQSIFIRYINFNAGFITQSENNSILYFVAMVDCREKTKKAVRKLRPLLFRQRPCVFV